MVTQVMNSFHMFINRMFLNFTDPSIIQPSRAFRVKVMGPAGRGRVLRQSQNGPAARPGSW